MFVSGIVPIDFPEEIWRPIVTRHGFGFTPWEPPLGEGVRHLRATKNLCDCGTALGRALLPTPALSEEALKLPAKAKTWSATRIARWREERERSAFRHEAQRFDDLERWEGMLRELLGAVPSKAPERWIGLLLHFYDGFTPLLEPTRVWVPEPERTVGLLARLRHDTLYRFLAPS